MHGAPQSASEQHAPWKGLFSLLVPTPLPPTAQDWGRDSKRPPSIKSLEKNPKLVNNHRLLLVMILYRAYLIPFLNPTSSIHTRQIRAPLPDLSPPLPQASSPTSRGGAWSLGTAKMTSHNQSSTQHSWFFSPHSLWGRGSCWGPRSFPFLVPHIPSDRGGPAPASRLGYGLGSAGLK